MTSYIAAIDQGTTSTRCILFDHSGSIVHAAQREHRQIYPQPGWVEHDPMEIWQNTQVVIQEVIDRGNIHAGDISAIGVTNQRETIVIWDKSTGTPLYNAIVWQDTRTKKICDRLAADGGQDRFRHVAGLPLTTYFSGPKITWLIENNPSVASAIKEGKALAWLRSHEAFCSVVPQNPLSSCILSSDAHRIRQENHPFQQQGPIWFRRVEDLSCRP